MNTQNQNIRHAFGYDATEDTGRRVSPKRVTKHEDKWATQKKRDILAATSRDLSRNFAIAAWAIRKHLDYVSSFSFQARTPDEGYNVYLEQFLDDVSAAHRFDIARRHPLRRAVRLAEACRIRDGDVFWLKIAPQAAAARGRIQAIEADRIRTPAADTLTSGEWINGVKINASGAAQSYAICDRGTGGRYDLRRVVPARNVFHHSFFDRYDQIRGVSPIAAGLNAFRDVAENVEYNLAKTKLAALFGISFQREGMTNPFGPGAAVATRDSDGDGVDDSDFSVDLPQGTFALDLEPGEKAEILESKTPSGETVNFLTMMIQAALKSLDIPYSFFDESFTNFFGSRAGLIQYRKSCKSKVQDLQDLQNQWGRWRFGLAVADGELDLPAGKGFDFIAWEFVNDGVEWWNPVQSAQGAAMSIAQGISNPFLECERSGTKFKDNIDQTAAALEYAKSRGVDLHFANSSAFVPEISTNDTNDD